MRRSISMLLTFILVLCLSVSCGKEEKDTPEKDCRTALEEWFKDMNDPDAGYDYYKEMLPAELFSHLEEKELLDVRIEYFRTSTEEQQSSYKEIPSFSKITSSDALSDDELKRAETYFADLSCYRYSYLLGEVKAEKGYEIDFRYTDENNKSASSVVCAVKLKGDGWKIINTDSDDMFYSAGR